MTKLIILTITFLTQNLFSFTLNGASFLEGFDNKSVSLYYNTASCPVEFTNDLKIATDFINSAPGSSITLDVVGTTAITVNNFSTFPQSTNEILVGCSVDFGNDYAGCDAACLAGVVGFATFNTSGATITKGYLILNENNGAGGEYSAQTDSARQIVMAHELVHSLGLGHAENPAALMHYSVAQKSSLNFHQDDLDGLNYLYPSKEPTDGFMGCGTISNNTFPPASKLLIVLAFLLPLLLTGFSKRNYSSASL